MSRKARSLISQIRLGILPLEMEAGRFRGVSPEDRILCQNCNMGVVECEVHFICECLYIFKTALIFTDLQYRLVEI